MLFSLARSLIYATREDLIPEFRDYAGALAEWGQGRSVPAISDYDGMNVRRALALTTERGNAPPFDLYRVLLGANARNLLKLDLRLQLRIDQPIVDNAGWLDVTHGITFANAVRRQCTRFPELWPRGLLQMACFSGRNSGFVDLFDHGREENIVAVHLLKTTLAARAEIEACPDDEASRILAAGVNRFLNSPLRRRHVRRTMRQAIKFVGGGE